MRAKCNLKCVSVAVQYEPVCCNPEELYFWHTFKQRDRKYHKPQQFTVVYVELLNNFITYVLLQCYSFMILCRADSYLFVLLFSKYSNIPLKDHSLRFIKVYLWVMSAMNVPIGHFNFKKGRKQLMCTKLSVFRLSLSDRQQAPSWELSCWFHSAVMRSSSMHTCMLTLL